MCLSNDLMRSLFEPVFDRIVKLLDRQLRLANSALGDRGLAVGHVLLAGGFSECPLLRGRVSL